MTIGQYIDESIMFQAGQLLRFSNASILEISEKFSFYDQFYFARWFKDKFDMSPPGLPEIHSHLKAKYALHFQWSLIQNRVHADVR
jgi:AraC-like DNA-binding protein